MKNLFKSTLKSFFRSKTAIILSSLLVFFSVATITLMLSTSYSFNESYRDLIVSNNWHDYTISEKYNINGELKFKEIRDSNGDIIDQTAANGETLLPSLKSNFISNDYENIYIQLDDKNSINVQKNGVTLNPIVSFAWNQFKFIHKKGNNTIEDIIPLQSNISFKIGSTQNSDLGMKNWDITTISDPKNVNTWLSNDILSFNISSSTNRILQKESNNNGISITTDKWAFIKNKIINFINNKNLFDLVYGKLITPSVDYANSIGVFQNLDNVNQNLDLYKLVEDKLQEFNTPIYSSLNPAYNRVDFVKLKEKEINNSLQELLKSNFRKQYIDALKNKNSIRNGASLRAENTISVSNTNTQFKVVNSTDETNSGINKLKIYSGFSLPDVTSNSEMNKIIDDSILSLGLKKGYSNSVPLSLALNVPGAKDLQGGITSLLTDKYFSGVTIDDSKGYKINANYDFIIKPKTLSQIIMDEMTSPQNIHYVDPTSIFAVLSPSYYDSHKNIQFVNPEEVLKKYRTELIASVSKGSQNEVLEKIFNKFKNSIISVGNIKYLAIGKGTQPDFAFPIIDEQNPIPNSQTQAIIFTNNSGFERILDSYRGNNQENYIAVKFNENADKEQIIKDIKEVSYKYFSWPSNYQYLTKNDDIDNKFVLQPQRVSFIKKLKGIVNIISIFTTIAIASLVLLIIIIVIIRNINSRKKTLGILLANGYTKMQISFSMTAISLIMVFIPSIIGFLIGHFMQFALILMFKDFWTIPIELHSFGILEFALSILIPITIVSICAFLVTFYILRGRLLDKMNGTKKENAKSFGYKIMRIFGWIGIKNKISVSIFTSNIFKMILIVFMTIMAIVSTTIGITLIGRFSKTKVESFENKNYTFSSVQVTPTDEGGLIHRYNLNEFLNDINNKSVDEIYNETLNHQINTQVTSQNYSNAYNNTSYFSIPNQSDAIAKNINVQYLRNKIIMQPFMDFSIFGNNPWTFTKSMLPSGQASISESRFMKFLGFGYKEFANNNKFKNEDWMKEIGKFYNNGVVNLKLLNTFAKKIGNTTNINVEYVKFVFSTLKSIVSHINDNDWNNYKDFLPYFISYNSLITDQNDELFTSISGSLNKPNGKSENLSILGIESNSKAIKLSDEAKKSLSMQNFKKGDEIPIIINKYFQKIYKLNINSTFQMSINNMSNRFSNPSNPIKTFKVVGLENSYDGLKAFTYREIANKVIGLDKVLSLQQLEEKNVWINLGSVGTFKSRVNSNDMFNGVFSFNEKPISLLFAELYSISGVYPGSDSLIKGTPQYSAISQYINSGKLNNNKVNNIGDFINKYTKNIYVFIYSDIDKIDLSQYTFDSILSLSSNLIIIIETIIIIIAIAFVFIVTTMIVYDNKKFLSTLRVLGYRGREIFRIFFRMFLVAVLIGAIISIPITILLLNGIETFIIELGNIYVPVHMRGWEMPLAFIFMVSLIIGIYFISAMELQKPKTILEAFKE
ncbi:MAG: hypothetical protein K4H23_05160 [Mollicutes bacterium PWAP]|nr:hypothetical protein [Mollicutes bacterium PWAP]